MSSSIHSDSEDEAKPPFLLKLYYKTGSFIRPEDFSTRHNPPPHIPIYAHPSTTLLDLALHATTLLPPRALPSPPLGTRLAFQLVFPDLRSPHTKRFVVKDLGSVVIGGVAPGVLEPQDPEDEGAWERLREESGKEEGKTLEEARFVVGDFVSCAVLPPGEDGGVVGVAAAKGEWRENGRGGHGGREHRGRGEGRMGGFGGAPGVPLGDWRRGERLPGAPPRERGGGRRW